MRFGRHDLQSSITGLSPALTALLVGGVLLLQLLFIASYVGGLHAPAPHGAELAVVGPPAAVEQASARIDQTTEGIDPEPYATPAAAREAIDRGDVFGALVLGQDGDRLLASQTWSRSFATEISVRLRELYAAEGRPLEVEIVNPLPPSDANGLSPFYLVVGWVVGGYLAAVVLALARGDRAATTRLAGLRIAALAAYAAISGLLGALLVDPVMDILHGHLLALWGIGALIVFAAAVATLALASILGVLGVGVAIALFVVLGNPASGAIFPSELLPQPWRAMGGYIVTGAGGRAVRSVQYFESANLLGPMLVLTVYAIIGSAVAVLASVALGRRRTT